jgi:xylulokinase
MRSTAMYLLGIDVGTTGVKTVLITAEGEFIGEDTQTYRLYSPQTNWFEQNPDDWWNAAALSIRQVLKGSKIDASEITGIGLTGQYHGLVIIDKNLSVLRPSILWNDQRTAKQSEYIIEKVGREKLLRIAATPGAPYFTACKLFWVREHEPELYKKVYKMMLPKDYVRLKLTGEFVTDVSDASGTIFLDIKGRKWSAEMLDLLDVNPSILPKVVESSDVSGNLSPEASKQTGLKRGIPVAGGAGDQAAAAVGNGIVEEGIATYSIGTSGVIYAATEEARIEPNGRFNTFCHAVPGQWCVLSCINSAAGSLGWFEGSFSDLERKKAEEEGKNVYDILMEKAGSVEPGSDKLFFLPYLAGERHPHTDPDARGVFFGIHPGHTKAHFIRAILEGVAYSFRDCLEVIRELGTDIHEIRATGGGAKSELWKKIMVNVSGEPIVSTTADLGGAAYGAAILGSVSAGVYKSVKEACGKLVKTYDRTVPDEKEKALYEKYFRFYRTLYPVVEDSYKRLSSL